MLQAIVDQEKLEFSTRISELSQSKQLAELQLCEAEHLRHAQVLKMMQERERIDNTQYEQQNNLAAQLSAAEHARVDAEAALRQLKEKQQQEIMRVRDTQKVLQQQAVDAQARANVVAEEAELRVLQAAKEAEAATVRAAEEVKAGASMAEQAMAAQLKSTKKDLEAAARARVEAELTSAEEEQKAIKRCRCVPL